MDQNRFSPYVRARPALVAFDLDDTLAPSKGSVDPAMAALLVDLARRVEVAIISGADIAQFRTQVVARLPEDSVHVRRRFHLLPTCGARYFRLEGAGVRHISTRALPLEHRRRAAAALEHQARRLGLWEEQPWGEIIEDRETQVTFSALGQRAPLAAKSAWDPSGRKRSRLCAAVSVDLPDLAVRSGGSTSIDVTEHGIDKAFGIQALARETGIAPADMMFFGDRLDEGGNDYPVIATGATCASVSGWRDTAVQVADLIEHLDAGAPAT